MNEITESAAAQPPVRKYELGQPIVRREQRGALERVHHVLAQAWSEQMTEICAQSATIEFTELEFGAFAGISLDEDACGQTLVFSIEPHQIGGFLMMSGELARFLVSRRLGLSASNDSAAPFTRLETAIANETLRAMATRLAEIYAGAGLGSIAKVRDCADLADASFAPDGQFALLKFHLNGADGATHLVVGVGASIVSALAQPHAGENEGHDNRGAIAGAVARLPIEVDVVLGRWSVPIAELLSLREGDRIVLPDGEDAWLAARGVRIRRASVAVIAEGARVQIIGSAP